MTTRGSRTASILCAVLAAGLAFSSAQAGTIEGTITAKKAKYQKNTVVYIDEIPGQEFSPPEEHVIMDQKGLEFIPHVLPVIAGTTVDFRNSDSVMHNVFTPDKTADKFNLGSWPQNEVRSHTFTTECKTACEAVMLCNVHPEMEAYVVILSNPYYAVTDEDGSFSIEGVPPGTYKLRTWNERLDETSQEIVIEAEGTLRIDIEI